jgi:preprotein translocase SecE subunit
MNKVYTIGIKPKGFFIYPFTMNRIQEYLGEAVEELHKVRWPTRNQAVRLSIIVIAFTLVSSLALGLLDAIFAAVVSLLISLR